MRQNWQRWVLPGVILLAAFLRLWRLGEMPPGLYHDEAYYGLDALSLLQGKTFPQFYEGWELYAAEAHGDNPPAPTRWPVFFEGNYGREPLHIYLMAVSIWLLGNTPVAVRIVPAFAGILAVYATYLAAAALFPAGRRQDSALAWLPLLAAFFVAIFFPSIHFSRFGLRVMLFLPVAALAVACFWQGMNRRQQRQRAWVWFAGAGVLVGLGLYTYAAARLFPLAFALFALVWLWQEREGRRGIAGIFLLMGGAAVVVALPLLLFFARYPYFFVFRMAYVANRGKGAVADQPWLTWLLNVGRVLRGLVWQGETHLRHNLPGRPFLDSIQAGFLLLGVAQTVRRLSRPRLFLLIWLGVTLLPSIFSGDAPHFGRLAGAAPPLAILAAWGVTWLWSQLARLRPARLAAAVVFLLLLGSALLTIRDYFSRYAHHPDLARDFYAPDWAMGQFAADFPSPASLYLSPTQEEMATIYFALGERWETLRSFTGEGGAVPAGIPGQPALYLIRPDAAVTLSQLQTLFPDGLVGPTQNGFTPFTLAAHTPRWAASPTPAADFGGQIRLLSWSQARRDGSLLVSLTWQAQTVPDKDYTAYVHVLDNAGNLLAQLDRPPAGYPTSDWQPGEIIHDTYTIPLPPNTPPGVEASAGSAASAYLQTGFYYLPILEPLGSPIRLTP
ncbi:MAG: hypothetical protein Fur0021_29100 [Candidatus Promineifilaceae bacterium]